jgi:hypothetical protein
MIGPLYYYLNTSPYSTALAGALAVVCLVSIIDFRKRSGAVLQLHSVFPIASPRRSFVRPSVYIYVAIRLSVAGMHACMHGTSVAYNMRPISSIN